MYIYVNSKSEPSPQNGRVPKSSLNTINMNILSNNTRDQHSAFYELCIIVEIEPKWDESLKSFVSLRGQILFISNRKFV